MCEFSQTIKAFDQSRYFIDIVDDYTGMGFAYTIRHKHQFYEIFNKFRKFAERWCNRKIKVVRTDFGTEFCNSTVNSLFERKGIRHEKSAPYIHHQNGKVERRHRTLLTLANCLLAHNNSLTKRYWPMAIKCANYLFNIQPRQNGISPHQLWYGRYDQRKLFKFGEYVFFIHEGPLAKGIIRNRTGIFLGYDIYSKAYKILDLETNRIVLNTNVVPKYKLIANQSSNHLNSDFPVINLINSINLQPINNINLINQLIESNDNLPRNFNEAMRSPERNSWLNAMSVEAQRLGQMGVFTRIKRNLNIKTVKTNWIYSMKSKDSDLIHKARLVCRGDQQSPSDYNETFAPSLPMVTIRYLLSIALKYDLYVSTLDIKSAYLYAPLNENIFIEIPDGIDDDREHYVYQVNYSLYGLRQSGHNWSNEITNFLLNNGFMRCPTIPTVFKHNKIKNFYIAIYVDDLLCVCPSKKINAEFYQLLSTKYDVHNLGSLKQLLGINFNKVNNTYKYDLNDKIIQLAREFNVTKDPRVITPLVPNEKIGPLSNAADFKNPTLYRKLLGSLSHIARFARIDVTYSVSVLSQFNQNPKLFHFKRLIRVLVYLLNTLDVRMSIYPA